MNRPILHFTPVRNWMNDPNGLIYYGGNYHMFYQHFPYAMKWGTMHWGHATSKDLLHWEHQPIALFPTKSYDQDGCFSGSAIEVDEELYLFYTAVRYTEVDEEDVTVAKNGNFLAAQALIISKDGYNFDNFKDKYEVIPVMNEESFAHPIHTRDPKVWKEGDVYYMVLGTKVQTPGNQKTTPKLLFYRSYDAKQWEYMNDFSLYGELGDMWECPDLFAVDGQYILAMSPENCLNEVSLEPSHAMFGLIDFNQKDCLVSATGSVFRFIDYGLDYYAPQTMLDEKDRRVQFGWLRMKTPVAGEEWIGMMTLPRILTVKAGHIYTTVHPNVTALFSKAIYQLTDITLSDMIAIDELVLEKPLYLKARMKNNGIILLGEYQINYQNGMVIANRSKVMNGIEGQQVSQTPIIKKYQEAKISGEEDNIICEVEIYIDRCVVEIYIEQGEYVISHVTKPLKGSIQSKQIINFEGYTIEN